MLSPNSIASQCGLSTVGLIILYLSSPFGKGADFNRDIRPILAEKCFHCHGPDGETRKADLRLDTEEGAFADLGGYAPVVKHSPEESEIVVRIHEEDPDLVMPPPEFKKPLSESEKALISQWIEEGANWAEHWAFRQPEFDPEVIASADGWSLNMIDHFIRNKQRDLQLGPNQEADRFTLARRAALDITGLPPSPEQLQTFIDDPEPDAYERYIDRLLASKHFGEHRARFWLDAARYADTHGLNFDNYREMWLYRDWVVKAFNENKPFDQFTIEQLAGDLLPSPTKSQLIATGFVRNNASSSEGGSIPEELAARYMTDRTETMSTVFLGLTAGCASCHDHKFDPISQKEFYEMAAFFNNATDPPIDGNMRDTYPVVVVPPKEHETIWNALQKSERSLQEKLSRRPVAEAQKWWMQNRETEMRTEHPIPDTALALFAPFDDLASGETTMQLNGKGRSFPIKRFEAATDHPHGDRGIVFTEEGGIEVPFPPAFQPDSPVTVSLWLRTPPEVKALHLLSQLGGADDEKGLKETGWNVEIIWDGGFEMPIRDDAGTKANSVMPSEFALEPDAWQHIVLRYSGGQSASSLSYLVNGKWRMDRRNDDHHLTTRFGDHISDILTIGENAVGGGISDLRIYGRWVTDDEVRLLANEFTWKQLVNRKPDWISLTPAEQQLAVLFYQFNVDEVSVDHNLKLGEMQTWADYIYARSATSLVMQEKPTPASAHVLLRGQYDQQGETVYPGVPAVLPPIEANGQLNRLDLADWLVSGENPLTSRVMVNRIWQSLFGLGLVRTSEDFGVMGEKPTHPELLDWLAIQFEESGWDVKALIRQIVTSSTYRQSSRISREELRIDPENRYLARGPRRRLDAEVLRDQALAVTGILDREMGGPPVKPYQPPGLWKAVALQGSNTSQFERDSVDKLHRRSLYSFWKRTSIPPAFAAFDAPTREECTVRRERTNTPLQALVLMNDEQHVEAARKLAEALISSSTGKTWSDLAKEAFFLVVGRPPTEADVDDLIALALIATNEYKDKVDEAKLLASSGALPSDDSLDPIKVATWTLVVNTLLNRDDVINVN